ncbi:flagellar basal-body MS-ring/collar protein FliF [Methylocystis sp. IM3]|uniref:flagellar basal-body MS-ring/collar protein FliF n=1 Tax=unclassified Methylocystis TaxID=2625913 RepID=UPI000FB54482|nr:MAG: flagellar M-ring protein FliF [Hyphomicrobiales bacterium]
MDHLTKLFDNLKALGGRKLAALGLIFALVVGMVSLAAYYLSRPSFEVLYAGLDREDVSRIGAALKSSGVAFDVNPEGNAVSVPYGQTAQARMLLAERGLPQSANAGYELFDKVGALGLTSFMQEVTRVRALEGELARTIQLIRGVKAARVHIVMPDEGSFRRAKQPPSASVIIRTEGPDDSSAAQAIRHLVASSLPGMTVDQVTVLNTDGMILSSSDGEATDAVPVKTLALEKSISKDIQDNIRRTLTPYLRLPNFQVSVRARVNTDRKQTNETIFDPDSRIERSIRTVKETAQSQNNSGAQSTSVERNIPQNAANNGDAKQSNDESRKSEELTNYELSSKTVTTVSGGYTVERLSVAVLINRSAFAEPGKEPPKPEIVDKQLKEIEQLVSSAAGLSKERGDALKVTAVDFMFNEHEMTPEENPGFVAMLGSHLGAIINALTAVGIAAIIVAFGLAPARRALLAEAQPASQERVEPPPLASPAAPSLAPAELPLALEPAFPNLAPILDIPEEGLLPGAALFDGIVEVARGSARKKLERLIEQDDAHAAAIMKQWMRS